VVLAAYVSDLLKRCTKLARIHGAVTLSVAIDSDGTVLGMKLLKGRPLLAPAAMDAVKRWRFRPAATSGRPIRAITVVDVNFSLEEGPGPPRSGPVWV